MAHYRAHIFEFLCMAKIQRLFSYDFFKGILIVGMIFAHVFYVFDGNAQFLERFFLWIPAGFVFFSGVLAGEVLWGKKSSWYFIRRAVQLLGIFIVANLFVLAISKKISFFEFSEDFIWGNQGATSFEILIPLALTILLVPLLGLFPPSLGILWGIIFLLTADIARMEGVFYSYNLQFLIIGILGFFFGRESSLENLRKSFVNLFPKANMVIMGLVFWLFIGSAYLGKGIVLEVFSFWTFQIVILFGIFLGLPNIFKSRPNIPKPFIRRFLEPLGVFSLFLYLFHILVIQALQFLMPKLVFTSSIWSFLLVFHITVLCFATIKIIEQIFKKFPRFEKAFRFLF